MIKILSLLILLPFLASHEARPDKEHVQQVSFEKIIFHTTECNGACAVYHLQVDADKSLKLFAEKVYKIDKGTSLAYDSAKTGYFTGMVNDTLFAHLEHELNAIELHSLEFNGASCCDGSLITIIVYYNGKRKLLKSMFPPAKARKLIGILYDICGKSIQLQKTGKFVIENEIPTSN